MARMAQLPVELHSAILHLLFLSSRQHSLIKTDWIDIDPRAPSIFPFNAASTCNLWREILATIPQCWSRIVFDANADPTLLLDAFKWSKSLSNLEIIVYTSSRDGAKVDKCGESQHVSTILQALRPHIHRCKSITFDITYASSLPLPEIFFHQDAPYLEELVLECQVNDRDLPEDICEQTWDCLCASNPDAPPLVTKFPNLKQLSLTGMAFMELCTPISGANWLKDLVTHRDLQLRISRFSFQDEFEGHYAIEIFASYLSDIRSLRHLHLYELSLAFEYSDTDPSPISLYDLDLYAIHFDTVSKDFLSAFNRYATCSAPKISFTRCAIPRILQTLYGTYLELDSVIPDECESENGMVENSLQRVLAVWSGDALAVHSCESFDDKLLAWLGGEIDYTPFPMVSERYASWPLTQTGSPFDSDSIFYHSIIRETPAKTFPAESIEVLSIHNCANYTFEKLRNLISLRTDAHYAENENNPDRHPAQKAEIEKLVLSGRHPEFSEFDVEWLKEKRLKRKNGSTLKLVDGGEESLTRWMTL